MVAKECHLTIKGLRCGSSSLALRYHGYHLPSGDECASKIQACVQVECRNAKSSQNARVFIDVVPVDNP